MNTTNQDTDGSRWRRKEYPNTAKSIFGSWGATQSVEIDQELTGGRGKGIFIILLEDGWHFAHNDFGSVYCAA